MLCLHNAVNLILKSTIAGGWYIVQANWTNRHKSHQLKSIVKNQHVQFDRHYSYHHQVWTCQEPGIFRTDNLNFTIRSKGNWLLNFTIRKDTCRKFRYNSIQIDSNSFRYNSIFDYWHMTVSIFDKWKTKNRASYCFSLGTFSSNFALLLIPARHTESLLNVSKLNTSTCSWTHLVELDYCPCITEPIGPKFKC